MDVVDDVDSDELDILDACWKDQGGGGGETSALVWLTSCVPVLPSFDLVMHEALGETAQSRIVDTDVGAAPAVVSTGKVQVPGSC